MGAGSCGLRPNISLFQHVCNIAGRLPEPRALINSGYNFPIDGSTEQMFDDSIQTHCELAGRTRAEVEDSAPDMALTASRAVR